MYLVKNLLIFNSLLLSDYILLIHFVVAFLHNIKIILRIVALLKIYDNLPF